MQASQHIPTSFTPGANLDEETACTVCRMIDLVGWQLKEEWDWNWLQGRKRNFRSLLKGFDSALLSGAWSLLAQKEWLSLQTVSDNERRISTIAPLKDLTSLRSLVLQNNLISDLQPLSGMVHLKYLNCHGNRITDLDPLRDLRSLEELHLGDNPLSSLAVLERLPNLRNLTISPNQVGGLAQCRQLPALQFLRVYGDDSVDNVAGFPDMPALKVLRLSGIASVSGIERLVALGTLELGRGTFPGLRGLEKLKMLTHCHVSTSYPLDLEPLSGLFALRSVRVHAPGVENLSALASLPVLHEVYIGNEARCNRVKLDALCRELSPWNQEFQTSENRSCPSLDVEIVSQEAFDLYDTKQPFGIHPGECEDGMFISERIWLADEFRAALKVILEEDDDFVLPGTTGFRRSESLVLYSLRAYESFREIATAVQRVLCTARNDWIIYCQSLLDEGPDCEELPEDARDFIVWIYRDKITATEDNAATVRKLIDWR